MVNHRLQRALKELCLEVPYVMFRKAIHVITVCCVSPIHVIFDYTQGVLSIISRSICKASIYPICTYGSDHGSSSYNDMKIERH